MCESVAPVRLQGVLEKRGKFTGVFLTRKCHCTLENGHLTYRKDGEKEKGLDMVHVQYIRPGKDCSFEIVTRSSTHIFIAVSVSERDDWVRALRESMRTTSFRLLPSSTKFLPPRSYSEDSAAFYETIPDSPKLATKSPRSQTLSTSAKNKSQKWLSVAPYETVNDPPDVVPSIRIPDLPAKISKDSRDLVSPVAVCHLYESVDEEEKCLVMYEDDLEGVSSPSNLPVSDEPAVESDLYAYARAEDVRKVVLKDKPKLCCEYSTVHDRRGSELLYSEVGVWDKAEEQAGSDSVKAVCSLATGVELTDGLKPDDGSFGIYQLANDPDEDMTNNQSLLPDGDCCSDIKVSGEEITRVFPQSLGHPQSPKVSASMAVLSKSSLNVTESNSKKALDCNALESSNSQHKAVCLNAPVSPKDFSVLYSKGLKPQCVPYPSASFPSPPLMDSSTVLASSELYNQVVKPAPDLYSKVVSQLSNESASISHSPSAALSFAPLAGNSTTFHESSILPCDIPDVYSKVVKSSSNESCTISHSPTALLPSTPLAGGSPESGTFDIYTKVEKPETSDSTLSKSTEGSSCLERIPRLPNPRISSKYQSPFDKIRRVMGETWEDGQLDELQSQMVPKGANAVDDLRLFLQKLDK